MANQKQTSFRILQSEKKNHYPAVWYGILGFCTGVMCSAILGYGYINNLSHEITNSTAFVNADLAEQDISENTQSLNPQIETKPLHADIQSPQPAHDDEHSIEFPQPQDNDLSKIFVHQTQPKPVAKSQNPMSSLVQTKQPSSSAKTATTAAVPRAVQKSAAVNKQPETKHAVKEKSPVLPKELEVEETPQASVPIAVTRTPVIHKDTAVTP